MFSETVLEADGPGTDFGQNRFFDTVFSLLDLKNDPWDSIACLKGRQEGGGANHWPRFGCNLRANIPQGRSQTQLLQSCTAVVMDLGLFRYPILARTFRFKQHRDTHISKLHRHTQHKSHNIHRHNKDTDTDIHKHLYVTYIYAYIYAYIYLFIYLIIYVERESERERDT